jgi:TPR repeat protein
MICRSHSCVLPIVVLLTLAACGGEEPQTTSDLVDAASHGDSNTMTTLENQVTQKLEEQQQQGEGLLASAQLALYSGNLQELQDLAAQDNPHACFFLGQELAKSQPEEGETWLRKAIDLGHAEAPYFLGKAKFHGVGGFVKEPSVGRALLEQSAASGNAQAAFDLGVAYRYGLDIEANRELALQWYEQALAGGYQAAEEELRQLRAE